MSACPDPWCVRAWLLVWCLSVWVFVSSGGLVDLKVRGWYWRSYVVLLPSAVCVVLVEG